ncbi:hypothetical protein Q6670_004106 [Salmonella enterica]|nr:hypothetical protein [Salmonella enterica]
MTIKKTHRPYSDKMAAIMKVRAYDVEATYPNGQVKTFSSMGGFKDDTGYNLPGFRADSVWFEMEIGDVAHATWKATDGSGTYRFTFTRRK